MPLTFAIFVPRQPCFEVQEFARHAGCAFVEITRKWPPATFRQSLRMITQPNHYIAPIQGLQYFFLNFFIDSLRFSCTFFVRSRVIWNVFPQLRYQYFIYPYLADIKHNFVLFYDPKNKTAVKNDGCLYLF